MPDILQARSIADTTSWAVFLAVLLTGYVVGCFNSGYYFVRWKSGGDIRQQGSGSTGATNVGRNWGRAAFMMILLVDMAKGALVAWLARFCGLQGPFLALAMLSVVVGHIWPAQLGLRGGKGIATFGGTVLATDPFVAFLVAVLFIPSYALLRRFTLSGLAALALSPLALAVSGRSAGQSLALACLILPVMAAHIPNFREETEGLRNQWSREGKRGTPFQER